MISAADISKMKFEHLALRQPWKDIIGKPSSDSSILMYSRPGSGKSTNALQFADELTAHGTVGYVAAEEGISPTLQEKLERTKLTNTAVKFTEADTLDDIKKYVLDEGIKFLFIDSFTVYDRRLKHFEEFRKWCKENDVFFVSIVQTTKEGKFYGNADAAFNVDCVLEVIDGRPSTEATGKNRLGELYEHDVDLRAKPVKPLPANQVKRDNPEETRFNPVDEDLLSGLELIEEDEDIRENPSPSPTELYDSITKNMIELIDSDKNLPWRKPWVSDTGYKAFSATNFISNKSYRGINAFLLNFFKVFLNDKGEKVYREHRYSNPYWFTFKQVQALGGKIKEGSLGNPAYYFTLLYSYKQEDPKIEYATSNKIKFIAWLNSNRSKLTLLGNIPANDFADTHYFPMLRYYNLYSGEDVEGIDYKTRIDVNKTPLSDADRIKAAELIFENYPNKPPLVNNENKRAFYSPGEDYINMPEFRLFNSGQEYYSTLFHESVHSTGHSSRLKREFGKKFGDPKYSFEELIAEFGAVLLSAEAGTLFKVRDNSAAYLKSFKARLINEMKKDNKFFFRASSRAQAAADYILDRDAQGIPVYQKKLVQAIKSEEKPVIVKEKPKTIGQYAKEIRELIKEKFGSGYIVKTVSKKNKSHSFISVERISKLTKKNIFIHVPLRNLMLTIFDAESVKDDTAVLFLSSKLEEFTTALKSYEESAPKYKIGDKVDIIWGEEVGKSGQIDRVLKFDKLLGTHSYVVSGASKNIGENNLEFSSKSNNAQDKTQPDPKEENDVKYPFSKDDIPYQVAYDAHRGTSFSPEKRAKAHQNEYFTDLKNQYEDLKEKAIKSDRLSEFEEKWPRFQEGYKKRYLAYLHSRNGLVSTMITGPSNFPVRRMEKKNATVDKRLKELIDYYNKGDKYLIPSINTDIKTGQEGSLTKLEAKLKKLVAHQEQMKRLNSAFKTYKKTQSVESLKKYNLSESELKAVTTYDDSNNYSYEKGRIFPQYQLSNNNANIRRVKQQVATEKKLNVKKEGGNKLIDFPGGQIELNYEINKIQIHFEDKPEVEIRSFLKKAGHAFKWSPKNKVWQRQLNTYYKGSALDLYKFLGVPELPKTPDPKPTATTPFKKVEDPTNITIDFKADGSLSEVGTYVIVEAKELIPSHNKDCSINSKHKISQGQPRDRSEDSLCMQPKVIAKNLNPVSITEGNLAFNGAPIVLPDNQVIQGNGRTVALKIAYDEHPTSAKKYKDYLISNAKKFGFTAQTIEAFNQPVLVREVNVSSKRAIELGNILDTSQAKMNRLDQAKSFVRQLSEQKRQIIGSIINDSRGETLSEIINDKGLKILDQINGIDRSGLVKANELTSDGKDFIKNLLTGLVFDSDKNKAALKHFSKLLHNTKAGIERAYGFIIPFIGTKNDLTPTLQKAVEIVQAVQNDDGLGTVNDFLNQGDVFTGANKDRFSKEEIELASYLYKQSTQIAIKSAFRTYYIKILGRVDLINPIEAVAKNEAFNTAFVDEERINPPEDLVKLYSLTSFKVGDIVRDYYDDVKYKIVSKKKETYQLKNEKTGKKERFTAKDKRFLPNREEIKPLPLFRINGADETLIYLGTVDKLDVVHPTMKGIEGNFGMFSNHAQNTLYIIPSNLVKRTSTIDDPKADKLFEQWHNYSADGKDLEIAYPSEAKIQEIGTASKIWYCSDKVMRTEDAKGKDHYYVHDFDANKRPVSLQGSVLIIEKIKWTERGILN